MYQAYGLLQPECDFNWDAALERLRAKLPHLQARRERDAIVLSSDDWELYLTLNAEPGVLADSADIAEKIAGGVDGTEIARCGRRIEIACAFPDPFMEHFSDFQAVIEVLQSFHGVIAVDPREPCLM